MGAQDQPHPGQHLAVTGRDEGRKVLAVGDHDAQQGPDLRVGHHAIHGAQDQLEQVDRGFVVCVGQRTNLRHDGGDARATC